MRDLLVENLNGKTRRHLLFQVKVKTFTCGALTNQIVQLKSGLTNTIMISSKFSGTLQEITWQVVQMTLTLVFGINQGRSQFKPSAI
jgi:hypothetical protein